MRLPHTELSPLLVTALAGGLLNCGASSLDACEPGSLEYDLYGCQDDDSTPNSDDDATQGGSDPITQKNEDTGDTAAGLPIDPNVQTFIPASYPPTNPVRLVFMGDSITAGYGASSNSLTYPSLLQNNDSSTWPEHDDADLETRFPDLTEVYDVSRGGAVTADLMRGQIPDLENQLPLPASGQTLFVMTIGGNDAQLALNPFANPENIRDDALEDLLEALAWLQDPANFPDGAFIYATNIYEPSDGVGQSECFLGFNYANTLPVLDEWNDLLYDLASEYEFSSVDLRGHFLGHGFYFDDSSSPAYDADDPTQWFDNDCLHPNDRGHHELRRLFHAAISGWPLPLK